MKKIVIVIQIFMLISLMGQTAYLGKITGKVEVQKENSSEWIKAEEGMAIELSDTISTGFGASATVTMGSSSVILKPLSRLTLDMFLETENSVNTSLYLKVGAVKAEVDSSRDIKQNFQVQSPFSTASVRGTVFEFDGKKLKVEEGRVALFVGKPKRLIQKVIIKEKKEEAERQEPDKVTEITSEIIEQVVNEKLEEVDEEKAIYVNAGESVEIVLPDKPVDEEEDDEEEEEEGEEAEEDTEEEFEVISAEEEVQKSSVVSSDTSRVTTAPDGETGQETAQPSAQSQNEGDVTIIWNQEE